MSTLLLATDVQVDLQRTHALLSRRQYNRAEAMASYDLSHALAVARWYVAEAEPAADTTPTTGAVESYRLLSEALAYQFDMLTDPRGPARITVEFTEDDPYPASSDALFDEVLSTRSIRVFKTWDTLHAIWTPEENDIFRAVHDLLGHCAWRNSFGPKGEDCAYRSHAATLPEYVLPAIAAETRGQNATFNYGHLIDGRSERQYAKQSWLPAPAWVYGWNL